MNANSPYDFSELSDSFQKLINDPGLMFQFLDMLPLPVEIFSPDGTSVYLNKAMMGFINVTDASAHVGKYNLLHDPVCHEIFGLESIERMFQGEAQICADKPCPIQDVVNRGVSDEKAFEAAYMDVHSYPIWNGDELVYVGCVFVVKHVYYERAEIVQAKKYIETNWREDYDDEKAAKAAHMSARQLRSIFKQSTGMTLNDYHKKCKVEHIKEKLADKNLSIKEAFAACGEDYRGTYLSVFKKVTGLTPTAFRASLK